MSLCPRGSHMILRVFQQQRYQSAREMGWERKIGGRGAGTNEPASEMVEVALCVSPLLEQSVTFQQLSKTREHDPSRLSYHKRSRKGEVERQMRAGVQQLEQEAKAQRTHLACRVHANCDDGLGRDALLKSSEDVHSSEVGQGWRTGGSEVAGAAILGSCATTPDFSFPPPLSKDQHHPHQIEEREHEPVLPFS